MKERKTKWKLLYSWGVSGLPSFFHPLLIRCFPDPGEDLESRSSVRVPRNYPIVDKIAGSTFQIPPEVRVDVMIPPVSV